MLDYRKVAELYSRGASINAIAHIVNCKWETVNLAIRRMGEKWGSLEDIPHDLDNNGIKLAILKTRKTADPNYLQPDFASLTKTDRKKQNSELWEAYCEEAQRQGKKAYQISYFNELLAIHDEKEDISYSQIHQPGLSSQVDWTGDKGHYIDSDSGELEEVEIFVMKLPFSGYFYAEAFPSQQMDCFLLGHQHGFEFLGGVTPIVIPDNCATAVDRKTGAINTRYAGFLDYYGALPKPARVRAPKDKGGVERHVGIVEREILPKLESLPITSLEEYNRILKEKVEKRNLKKYSKREGCRTDVFLAEERPRLKNLPKYAYHSYKEKIASVSRDYHIQYDNAFYSVPVTYIGQKVKVQDSGHDINIFSSQGRIIANHKKAAKKWQRVTDINHIPNGHTPNKEYTLEQFLSWGAKFGPNTEELCRVISESFTFPVQSFRTLNTILIKAEHCDFPKAVEEASERCVSFGIHSSKGFANMLSALLQQAKEAPVNLNGIYCSHEENGNE